MGASGNKNFCVLVMFDSWPWHPFAITFTVKPPLDETTILWLVSPVLHTLFALALEVRVMLLPSQNMVDPLAVIVGLGGMGFTVTTTGSEVAVQPKVLLTVRLKLPLLFTKMYWPVAPVLHKLLLGEDDINCTWPPVQKVIGPPAVITGLAGSGFAVTTIGWEVDVHPFAPDIVTV